MKVDVGNFVLDGIPVGVSVAGKGETETALVTKEDELLVLTTFRR